MLTAVTQTIAWCIIFFFASAGASAAYLTVSEIFPMEVRAKAIAVFFAIAQVFGAVAPLIYARMIGPEDAPSDSGLFWAYILGAVVMMIGGVVAPVLGVAAEKQVARGHRHPALGRAGHGRRGRGDLTASPVT